MLGLRRGRGVLLRQRARPVLAIEDCHALRLEVDAGEQPDRLLVVDVQDPDHNRSLKVYRIEVSTKTA